MGRNLYIKDCCDNKYYIFNLSRSNDILSCYFGENIGTYTRNDLIEILDDIFQREENSP